MLELVKNTAEIKRLLSEDKFSEAISLAVRLFNSVEGVISAIQEFNSGFTDDCITQEVLNQSSTMIY